MKTLKILIILLVSMSLNAQHKIVRYEKSKSTTGEITAIFLAVTFQKLTESTTFEYHLTPDEVKAVVLSEATLKPILNECYALAELKLEDEILTRPQPTEFMNESKRVQVQAMTSLTLIASRKILIIADRKKKLEKEKEKEKDGK